jgi:hypothetical protein
MDPQAFAEYWGGTGPTYEAQAAEASPPAEASPGAGAWLEPQGDWWDGEKIHNPEAYAREVQAAAEREPEAELW